MTVPATNKPTVDASRVGLTPAHSTVLGPVAPQVPSVPDVSHEPAPARQGLGVTGNPEYDGAPFTDFATVTPDTPLESLNLNWREMDLPERERTKHVHRLHPYLGKFIPQLVEIFLRKYQPSLVCDPFCGSGTTLVEGQTLGIPSAGFDISPFNCLLARVKTAEYDLPQLEASVQGALSALERQLAGAAGEPSLPGEVGGAGPIGDTPGASGRRWPSHPLDRDTPGHERESAPTDADLPGASAYRPPRQDAPAQDAAGVREAGGYLQTWFAPQALRQLLAYRAIIDGKPYEAALQMILSRAARSARLAAHFDLDFPKTPMTAPYYCHKHHRICHPTEDALGFLRRYSIDLLRRVTAYAEVRGQGPATVTQGDARVLPFPPADLVVTSPPYVGLIDYHQQHRYAYELLGLQGFESAEIGAAVRGASARAVAAYVDDMVAVFSNVASALRPGTRLVVVVHDRRNLYDEIARRVGVTVEHRLLRHVNRRTGRRAGDFFEHVLVWKT